MSKFAKYVRAAARLLLERPERRSLTWPPGTLNLFVSVNKQKQNYLLDQAKKHGPIFKQWMRAHHTTCILDLDKARHFLRESQSKMTSITMDQTPLYPRGNLRVLQGEEHKHYRKAMISAVRSAPISVYSAAMRSILLNRIAASVDASAQGLISPDNLRRALHEATTDMMFLAVFGVAPGSPESTSLKAAYDKLGLEAPSNSIGDLQKEAFSEIAAILSSLEGQITENPDAAGPSCLRHLVVSQEIDATLRGNLIYMVETTRYDVASLWRWILFYLGSHVEVAELARQKGADDPYLNAVIFETFRLNQAEYLMRRVMEDTEFNGYFIPKGSHVRVCVWEGHKNPETFPEPFSFRPERFIENGFSVEQYAPFGMDKHRCLGADFTIDISRLFIETMLQSFNFASVDAGEPVRGKHHWEPSREFTIRLSPRQ